MASGKYERKEKYEKICSICGINFKTSAHNAKYCPRCKDKSHRDCKYCGKSFKIVQNTQHYCPECKLLTFDCQCGCGQKIKFSNWIKNKKLARGHNRKGYKKPKIAVKPIKEKKITYCIICGKQVLKPQRKTCSRECHKKLAHQITLQKWKNGECKILTGNVGIKGCYYKGIYLRSS